MSRIQTLNEMKSIQLEFEQQFADLPGVIGIGLGKDKAGGYELKVYVVDAQASQPLPQRFHDARVAIEITGKISAH